MPTKDSFSTIVARSAAILTQALGAAAGNKELEKELRRAAQAARTVRMGGVYVDTQGITLRVSAGVDIQALGEAVQDGTLTGFTPNKATSKLAPTTKATKVKATKATTKAA